MAGTNKSNRTNLFFDSYQSRSFDGPCLGPEALSEPAPHKPSLSTSCPSPAGLQFRRPHLSRRDPLLLLNIHDRGINSVPTDGSYGSGVSMPSSAPCTVSDFSTFSAPFPQPKVGLPCSEGSVSSLGLQVHAPSSPTPFPSDFPTYSALGFRANGSRNKSATDGQKGERNQFSGLSFEPEEFHFSYFAPPLSPPTDDRHTFLPCGDASDDSVSPEDSPLLTPLPTPSLPSHASLFPSRSALRKPDQAPRLSRSSSRSSSGRSVGSVGSVGEKDGEGCSEAVGLGVRFCDRVVTDVIDTYAGEDYPGRKGDPPVQRLTMREYLELREIKEQLGILSIDSSPLGAGLVAKMRTSPLPSFPETFPSPDTSGDASPGVELEFARNGLVDAASARR